MCVCVDVCAVVRAREGSGKAVQGGRKQPARFQVRAQHEGLIERRANYASSRTPHVCEPCARCQLCCDGLSAALAD